MARFSTAELVQCLVRSAIRFCASDLHAEPMSQGLRIRYRIDGLLHEYACVLAEYSLRVVTHIKVLAQLDIGERRLPQDGKYVFNVEGGRCEVRVATFPSMYGESFVFRFLEQSHSGEFSLSNLGMPMPMQRVLTSLVSRSHGLYIVTGPTGSGKSTTLYAMLRELVSSARSVVTLEDPIEYTIPGALQAHVRADIGFGFAAGIRAIVRQDPDVIMVGEMRDRDTVETALRAALTGHLVVTTLHTPDAVSALTRLHEMGAPHYLISAVVSGVIAQRLVRVLCSVCSEECEYDSTIQPFPLAQCLSPGLLMRVARGCDQCHYRGYRGRIGIFEFFVMTEELRNLLASGAGLEELRAQACAQGMQTLIAEGIGLVKQGITSIDELIRAVV